MLTTNFERAIFYSWACQLDECCKYCYMSTLPKEKRTEERVRSFPSLLAETIILKAHKWDYGFLSGGIRVFPDEKIFDLLKKTDEIIKEKIWINIGILNKKQLIKFAPFIKGVVGTIETIDPKLHKEICPSKSIEDVESMFEICKELDIDRGITFIVGLGETIKDFKKLKDFISKWDVKKIHIYGLNPHKGTIYEDTLPPTAEYQAKWISKTREAFPDIDIQMGIWIDRVERISTLLKAGANSISKFPATRYFGTIKAKEIEEQAKLANRKFVGTLTKVREKYCYQILDKLNFNKKLKEEIKVKLEQYLKKFKKNIEKSK
jgi:biotin synthase-like enzyme